MFSRLAMNEVLRAAVDDCASGCQESELVKLDFVICIDTRSLLVLQPQGWMNSFS